MRLKDLSLARKMAAFVAVVTALNLLVGGWALLEQRSILYDGKHREVAAIVQAAYSIVDSFGEHARTGRMPEAEAKAAALQALRALRYEQGDYVWVNDLQHVVVMHPIKPELDGKDVSGLKDPAGTYVFREFVTVARTAGAGFVDYLWPKPGFDQPVEKTSYVKLHQPWGWVIGSGLYLDDVQAEFLMIALRGALSVLAVTAVMLGFAWTFVRNVAVPLTASVGAVQRLADEDLTVEAGDGSRADEIGDLSRAISAFKTKLEERRRLTQRQEAEGADKARRHEASDRLIRDFSASMAGVLAQLADASSAMSTTAGTVDRSSAVTTDKAVTVSAAAEQASANVQTVSAAAQELASSIAEVTRQVGQASSVTEEAQRQAGGTAATVARLRVAAGQISEVLDLIGSIAAQTNLLALNATIEAARAGDAGKGFAVVASEVKGLATQTARATEDISRQIAEMQQASTEAGDAIGAIAGTIERIGGISASVAAAMDQQNAATQEIVRSVEEVAGGTGMVAESIDSVRGAAIESREAAGSVASTAAQLSAQTEALRQEVGSFLEAIGRAGERRDFERYDCDLEATVELGAAQVHGRLRNVGLGGALFAGRLDGLPGDRLVLSVNGHRIAGQLVEAGAPARLRFALDAANQGVADALLARLAA